MKRRSIVLAACAALLLSACERAPTTDEKQARAQARSLSEADSQIGMPAITNFAERRMMKDLLERRDKPFPTHTYIFNERQSCLDYLGPSVGYGLPYAAQYTSPTRVEDIARSSSHYQYEQVPQAEPNGLFMPDADFQAFQAALADVYYSDLDIRSLLKQTGANLGRVSFTGAARITWTSAIESLWNQGKAWALFDCIRSGPNAASFAR